jgi:hypothetical protein
MPDSLLRRAQAAIDDSIAARKERRGIRADFEKARASLALSVLKSEAQRLEFIAARENKE